MTEKVWKLYEEEQVGKTWEGRKAVPRSKMPDLGWDIAEPLLQETNEKSEDNTTHTAPCLQLLITITIIITAILQHIAMYVKEIPRITNKTVQVVKSMTIKASHNKLLQSIKKNYKTAALAITIVTNSMDRTNRVKQPQTTNRNAQNSPGTRKLNDEYDRSYQSHTSRTHHNNGN